MAGSLHGSARTTPRVRAELQASQDITSSLAQRYSLSRTTGQQGANPNHDHECVAGAELSLQHRAHAGGGGDGGRVPPPHAAAARRRPAFLLERRARLPTRQHPKAYPLKPAPMPGTVRHLPPARKPGQRLQAGQICCHSDRLRPSRYQRTAPGSRQAQHVPGHRPRVQVHLCRVPRRRREDERRQLLRGVVEAFSPTPSIPC